MSLIVAKEKLEIVFSARRAQRVPFGYFQKGTAKMEDFENKPKIENKETTPEFHFREIAEIEPAMVSLVKNNWY